MSIEKLNILIASTVNSSGGASEITFTGFCFSFSIGFFHHGNGFIYCLVSCEDALLNRMVLCPKAPLLSLFPSMIL
jgi:hypothetical protein